MIVRRVITGQSGGKAIAVSDGPAPRSHDFVHFPGLSTALLWSTQPVPNVPYDMRDPVTASTTHIPPPGETRLMIVKFPPDSISRTPGFDGAAAAAEYSEVAPDIASRFEPDNSGMHTTDTVDYCIVLEGEVWLELGGGESVHLESHDVVVQNGTRHAWRNESEKPVKMAFILVGAKRNI